MEEWIEPENYFDNPEVNFGDETLSEEFALNHFYVQFLNSPPHEPNFIQPFGFRDSVKLHNYQLVCL